VSTTDLISPVSYQFECGEFEWRVRAIVLEERLSQPLCAELRLLTRSQVTPSDLVGVPTRVTIDRDGAARTFVGEVTRAEATLVASGETHVRVRFEPLLARARRLVRHRIFQSVSVLDIVQEVLGPVADCDFERVLDHDRIKREYCVQYAESDLDFAMRLLEDEGIAWFLDFGGPRTVMHLVEAARGYPVVAAADPELRLVPEHFEEATAESLQGLTAVQRAASPAVVERDWQWMMYASNFEQIHPEQAPGPYTEVSNPRRIASPMEVMTTAEIDAFTKASVRAEYERSASRDLLLRGSSNATSLAAGSHFLFDLGRAAPDPLLVLSVEHRGDCPDVELDGRGGQAGPRYSNTFECQPLAVPHRPPRTIPRPRIHSLHTAVVTGAPGEEIDVDYKGCIVVRMHWDRSNSAPELASCRLRVAQTWAGQGWGSVFIPRVGMEVLVAFLDGDPDRPLCVGCVYNGEHLEPYSLPDERTKSTIRTQSSPGGNGYNELTFEDAAGREEVYVRAQRNLRTQVLANESRSVGHDQSVEIGHDQTLTIGGDQHTTIKGNQTLTVDGGGTDGLAGTAVEVKGAVEVKVTEPGTVRIEAAERIELCVGGSSITIDGERITLRSGLGTTQTLDATAVLLPKNGSMLRLSGSVQLSAAPDSPLEVFSARTTMASAAGSYVVLTDNISIGAELGARMLLTADATLDAATITATAGQGAKLALDANAAVTGSEVSCTGGGGSLTVGPSGAALDGTTVDVSAAAVASLVAPMVKIN